MPRYVIERVLGDISDDELVEAATLSKSMREADFPQIDWEHSHVVHANGGLTSFCIYRSPDVETIRHHAAAVGIPADRIYEIHADIVPHDLG